MDITRNHPIDWRDLQAWHEAEGYGDQLQIFRNSVNLQRKALGRQGQTRTKMPILCEIAALF